MPKCVVCHNEFEAATNRKTCGPECRNTLRKTASRRGGVNKTINAFVVSRDILEANKRRAEAEYARFWEKERRDYAGVHGET